MPIWPVFLPDRLAVLPKRGTCAGKLSLPIRRKSNIPMTRLGHKACGQTGLHLGSSRMKRTHVMIGLASLIGAVLIAGSALAVPAVFSPTGHLNVRSGPGFQYGVVAQMPANTRFPVTGCIQDYSWCSVVVGNVTGWASAPYLVTDAGGKPTNLQVSGAQLGIPIVVPTPGVAVVATPPVGAMVPTPALVEPILPAPEVLSFCLLYTSPSP